MKQSSSNFVHRALVLLLIITAVAQNAQKPRFEVSHKAGTMDVTASQFNADVSLKSDKVDVDVKPGDTDVPLQTNSQRVLHVYQLPMIGKKSQVFRKAKEMKWNFANAEGNRASVTTRTAQDNVLKHSGPEAQKN